MVYLRLKKIERYAKKNNVPIMEPDGICFLLTYIKEHNITSILEIGSAIGYSAIKMALVDSSIHITTIERDPVRYQEAILNIKKCHLEHRVTILNQDAFDVSLESNYDLIFIDAAKSQMIKFFEKFKKNLNQKGVIITDNLNFHGLTHTKEEIKSKNLRSMVHKINEYITFLNENKEFKTEIVSIGDGISISERVS